MGSCHGDKWTSFRSHIFSYIQIRIFVRSNFKQGFECKSILSKCHLVAFPGTMFSYEKSSRLASNSTSRQLCCPRGSTITFSFKYSSQSFFDIINNINSWFATTWQGGHVGGQYKRNFSAKFASKLEFISQRREMLLFLTPNMAAMTSLANQQYVTI